MFSILATSIRPMWLVLATWVPPSACWSRPTMSMIRTSSTSGGTRLVAVRMMSGSAKASRSRQHPRVDPPVRAISALQAASTASRKPVGQLGQVEVHPGGQRLHVAAGHQRAVVAEDDAAQHVQAGVRAHQRGPALVLDRAADRGARRRHRIAVGRDQVQVIALAGAGDAGLHAAPQQHALVRRLAAAAGVEGRPVQDDAVLAGLRARRRPTRAASGRRARAGGCATAFRSSAEPSARHGAVPVPDRAYQGPYGPWCDEDPALIALTLGRTSTR